MVVAALVWAGKPPPHVLMGTSHGPGEALPTGDWSRGFLTPEVKRKSLSLGAFARR